MARDREADALESEIFGLFQYIERFRQEIARINSRDDEGTFRSMSQQLDAIVEATGHATHGILENLEGIDAAVEALRASGADPELCGKISRHAMFAMENCTFQDIMGQRITKVVRSMKFVEERVNAMVDLLGRDTIERLSKALSKEEKTEDEKRLEDPQRADKPISQKGIDALFD